MKFTIHANGVQWQKEYLPRFTQGLVNHGFRVEHSVRDEADPDAVNIVFANNSWKNTVQNCIRKAIPLITVGRCFFGSRHDMVAIGWDGFNAEADFCLPKLAHADRWNKHGVELQPWRPATFHGDYVLVCGEFRNMNAWYKQLYEDLKGLEVRFRPHPFVSGAPNNWKIAPGPKQDGIHVSLERAEVCVTYDSISGCDSVLAGIPTICYGANAMAADVAFQNFHDYWINYASQGKLRTDFNRFPWVCKLAYCQWSHDEICAGEWWQHLEIGFESRNQAKPNTKRDRYSLKKLQDRSQARREQKLR